MAPHWKEGWINAALILLVTLPFVATVIVPSAVARDTSKGYCFMWTVEQNFNDLLLSLKKCILLAATLDLYWASSTPSKNAPGWRMAAGFTLIANNSKALVAGGYVGRKSFDTLHLYDIASGSWEELELRMNNARDSFYMATFNNEIVQDLVVIMGPQYDHSVPGYQVLDLKTPKPKFLDTPNDGIDAPITDDGACTTWKDLFIVFSDEVGLPKNLNHIFILNVTSWTWSQPNLTGDPLPWALHANMVVVPSWKGRDTAFIYTTTYGALDYIAPDEACKYVFAVDLETWNVTRHVTRNPGPIGEFGSSTSLVSTDPLGNRYFYHYGGMTPTSFSSDLNVLRFEPELDWDPVQVRPNPRIQGSWMGILIGGLPQNMPAWIGEEPLVHILGGQRGQLYVSTENHLMLGGISPNDSIINTPTVNDSLVSDIFQVYAGDTIRIAVEPRNAFGVTLPYSGDDVWGFVRHMDGTEKSCAMNEDINGNSVQYIINCWVAVQGNYTFRIKIQDFIIVPKYQLFVQPAAVSVANSIAEGYGMQQANAKEVAVYKIKLYDIYGNRASVVSEDIHVTAVVGCYGNVSLAEAELLDASSFEQVDAVVTLNDPVNSLYTIEYIPRKTGVCKIQNLVNDVPFGNVTFVVVGDPAGFTAIDSAEGATFMVLNILSCLAACVAAYLFGIKAKVGYRDGVIFSSGALALIGNLLYIGEPLDATCRARSAIAMVASGMLMGVMWSQTWWYLGYSRTPILAKQMPISPQRALKYASAAVCCEGLLIIILQTTTPIHQSIFTVNGKAHVGCTDATGNNILYAHLVLLCFISGISFLTNAHKSPDVTTSINSIMGYNLTILASFLVGLIGILRNEDMQIFFVLQSLDIWIACMLTFGLVIYSKMHSEGKNKPMKNIIGGKGQMQTLAVDSTSGMSRSTVTGKSQMLALAHLHLRQDDLKQTTWKKSIYFHSNEYAYGVIYSDFSEPGISLENIEEVSNFENDTDDLRYGLRLKVNAEEKELAFASESDRDEYLEALKKIRVTKRSLNV